MINIKKYSSAHLCVCYRYAMCLNLGRKLKMDKSNAAECRALVSDKKENFIVVLKAIACLLITNSHCKEIYPVPFFAVGGSFGNAIFFLVSGYCLGNIKLGFGKWYQRRLKCIMPSVILIILLDIFLVEKTETIAQLSLIDFCIFYIDHYWFVSAILLWYIIFYIVFIKKSIFVAKIALLIHFVGYIFGYIFFVDKTLFSVEPNGFGFFKAYFYLGIMLVGGILKLDNDYIIEKSKNKKGIFVAVMVLSFIFWAVTWGSINIMHIAYRLQFFVHIWVCCFVIAFFLLIEVSDVQRYSDSKIIKLISESTLEIYLIQVTFKKYVMIFGFPINFIFFMVLAFGGGIFFCKVRDRFFLLSRRKEYQSKMSRKKNMF